MKDKFIDCLLITQLSFSLLPTGEGGWSAWSSGPCSRTCGGGTRMHTRNCTTSGNLKCCPGNATVIETCGEDDCGEIMA